MRDKNLNHFTGRDFTRQKARIRDNFTCQRCLKKWKTGERRFDIHHLRGLCGKKSKGYDRSMIHLITYCHKCHLTLHSVKSKMRAVAGKKTPIGTGILKIEIIKFCLKKGFRQIDIAVALKVRPQTITKYIERIK